MLKWISSLFLGALAVGLSIYTGSRTLDLLGWILPADQQLVQYLGLAAFELGMYFWCFYFVAGAKGIPQRSIAVVMACFSIIAVSVCTIADTLLGAAKAGKVRPFTADQSQALITFVSIVIVANVAAFLACKLLSIDNLRKMREQNAEDTIHEAGLNAITQIAPHIASQAAPYLAQEWAHRTWQHLVPGGGQMYFLPAVQQPAALPQPANSAPVAQSSPAPEQIVSSKPEKKGFNPLGFLPKKKEALETYTIKQDMAQDLAKKADEFRREEYARKHEHAAKSIDTEKNMDARPRPSLEARKKLRRARFISAKLIEPGEKEVAKEQPNFPPERKPMRIQKRRQTYVVNKRPAAGLPIHD